MRVILIADVKELGKAGSIKDVSDGYAKNFLFVKKLAKIATPELIKKNEQKKMLEIKKAEENLKIIESAVNSLDGISIKIKVKANKEGKLFGSVTPEMIIEVVKKEIKNVKSLKISTSAVIKEIGEHKIILNFSHGLEAEIIIIVEKE